MKEKMKLKTAKEQEANAKEAERQKVLEEKIIENKRRLDSMEHRMRDLERTVKRLRDDRRREKEKRERKRSHSHKKMFPKHNSRRSYSLRTQSISHSLTPIKSDPYESEYLGQEVTKSWGYRPGDYHWEMPKD